MFWAALALLLTNDAPARDEMLADYVAQATGTFSSQTQHREDPRYDWVEARTVRIWPERNDGIWLYQEQAIITVDALAPEEARRRPYFQFVSRLKPIGTDTIRRDNFRVLDGSAWVGVAEADPRLTELSLIDLAPASCHNRIERVGVGHFTARTESCDNAYKGASYMISRSVLTPDGYVNWDRGFDAQGALVWGPRWGGYRFDRTGE